MANTRILRGLVKLMDYNFTVEYLPGVENSIADIGVAKGGPGGPGPPNLNITNDKSYDNVG